MTHYDDHKYGYCSICSMLNNDLQQCGCKDKVLVPNRPKPPTQVGGSHYDRAIQPIEYIEANQLGFHEANVIKYITRYKDKNGIEDLNKAKWYIDRLISTYKGH